MWQMELPGKRKRGRPQSRFMDVVKEEVETVGVRVEEAGDWVRGGQMIWWATPEGSRKEKTTEKKQFIWIGTDQCLRSDWNVFFFLRYSEIILENNPKALDQSVKDKLLLFVCVLRKRRMPCWYCSNNKSGDCTATGGSRSQLQACEKIRPTV